MQTRAFTQSELRQWMDTRAQHGNQVSPWFGVMEKRLLYKCVPFSDHLIATFSVAKPGIAAWRCYGALSSPR